MRVQEWKPKSSNILEIVNILSELQTQARSCKELGKKTFDSEPWSEIYLLAVSRGWLFLWDALLLRLLSGSQSCLSVFCVQFDTHSYRDCLFWSVLVIGIFWSPVRIKPFSSLKQLTKNIKNDMSWSLFAFTRRYHDKNINSSERIVSGILLICLPWCMSFKKDILSFFSPSPYAC